MAIRRLFFCLIALLMITSTALAAELPTSSHQDSPLQLGRRPQAVSVTCDDGTRFTNGVEILVNMRTGFTYTATAIGLDGFDPVLAVLDASGTGECNDDSTRAARYEVDLPSAGGKAKNTDAQVTFSYTGRDAFGWVSLVVGGYSNTTGQFALVLEGMWYTQDDGAGDPFSVSLTDNLVQADAPLIVYLIANTNDYDPFITVVDDDLETPWVDGRNNPIYCDDAGNKDFCWGDSVDLTGSFVNNGQKRVPGGPADSMIFIPLGNVRDDEQYVNFLMSSYNYETTGPYTLVFHMSTVN